MQNNINNHFRDIKPENILFVDEDPNDFQIKIIDFNISCFMRTKQMNKNCAGSVLNIVFFF